jgi:hypothetical protein
MEVEGRALLMGGGRPVVVEVEKNGGEGRVILSQLLTAGRMARGYGGYYDPVAAQLVLNLIRRAYSGR